MRALPADARLALMLDPMPVGALIATDRRPRLLERCLAGLLSGPTPGLVHVLVVVQEDDEEGARVVDAWTRRDARVEMVFTRRRSRSAARNEAAALSKGHWIWFIDDDAEALPGACAVLQEAIAAWPAARAVGGPNVGPAGASPFERAADAALSSALGAGRMSRRYREGGPAGPCGERELIACNLAVDKDEFLARRFDERLDYGEETLLLARMRLDGLLLVREPRLVVTHRRRDGWRAYARQAWRSGVGRGRQTALLPASFSPECAGPASLLAAAAAAPWSAGARLFLLVYGAACVLEALRLAARGLEPAVAARLPALLAVGHAAYGAGTLAGLLPARAGAARALADAAASPRAAPLRGLFQLYYAAAAPCVRLWARAAGLPVSQLRVHRGFSGSEWRPGVSDVDLAGLWRPGDPAADARALASWRRGYGRLRRAFPVLGEVILADEASWRRYRASGDFRGRGDAVAAVTGWASARARLDRWTEGLDAYVRLSRAVLDDAAGWRRSRNAAKLFLDVARHGAVGAASTRRQAASALAPEQASRLAAAEAGDEDALAWLGAEAARRLDAWARETLAAVPDGEAVPLSAAAAPRPGAAAGLDRTVRRLEAAGAGPSFALFDSVFGAWLSYPIEAAASPAMWRALREHKRGEAALAGTVVPLPPAALWAMAWSAHGEDPLKAVGWRAAAPAAASGDGPLLARHEIALHGDFALLPPPPPRELAALMAEECAALFSLHWRGRWAGPGGASAYDVWTRLLGRALAARAWAEEGALVSPFPLEPLARRHAARRPEDADWLMRRVVERAALGGWEEDAAFLARQAAALSRRG